MKKVILGIATAILFSIGAKAQLKVDNSGRIALRTTSPTTTSDVTIQQTTHSSSQEALLIRNNAVTESMRFGQFNGNAHVGSTTDIIAFYHAFTSYNKVYAQQYIIGSDRKIKSNIESIENGLDMILKMRGVSYNLNEDLENGIDKTVYGFISQEVQEFLPELTSEQMDILCMDYLQIIPFLVSGMQEQHEVINDLQEEVNELRKLVHNIANATGYDLSEEETKPAAVLYQNKPNPFKERTVIAYELPETFSSASIMIFDMTGEMLEQYPIYTRDSGQLTIEGRQFKPGMYLYSLIVDDVEVDTKKMILNK